MKIRHSISFAICGLALACGGDSSGDGGDTGTGTTDASADDDDDDDDDDEAEEEDPSDPDTGPIDSSGDDGPLTECERTIRYPLFDGQACGRVVVGAIDGDSFDDVVAFGRDASFIDVPVTTTLQTFLGGNLGLDDGEVHCCTETSAGGPGGIFDINGDGDGDPLWAGARHTINGDVGNTVLTIERIIRGPEGGYTGAGVLFNGDDTHAPAFTIGTIMQNTTGVIVVADGALQSLVGTGADFGLEATHTLALDPVPVIYALETIELDGMAGVDAVGIGPDGLYLWPGSTEGGFAEAQLVELPGEYTEMESIDVDSDGNRELVLFGEGEPIAYVERTNMVVVMTEGMRVLPPPATVVEVDDDPFADVVAVEDGNLGYYPFDLDTRTFGDPILLAPAGTATDLAHGDLDNNGVEDIVVCDELGVLVVYGADD